MASGEEEARMGITDGPAFWEKSYPCEECVFLCVCLCVLCVRVSVYICASACMHICVFVCKRASGGHTHAHAQTHTTSFENEWARCYNKHFSQFFYNVSTSQHCFFKPVYKTTGSTGEHEAANLRAELRNQTPVVDALPAEHQYWNLPLLTPRCLTHDRDPAYSKDVSHTITTWGCWLGRNQRHQESWVGRLWGKRNTFVASKGVLRGQEENV